MACIETVHAENWPELAGVVDEYFSHYSNYIFRGQADSEWRLQPTINRVLNGLYAELPEKNEALEFHKARFRENIRGRVNFDLKHASDAEVWALGQHFGLSTPLLDWSLSPYVALFFSLFGPCESGNRVLWAILKDDIEVLDAKKRGSQKGVAIVNPMTHYNDRLVSQRGLFLNIPIGVDLEDWVRKGKDCGWVTLYKITFPDKIREDALSALNIRNINHLSLFPDVSGAALYANYQLEIEPYLEQSKVKHPWEVVSI